MSYQIEISRMPEGDELQVLLQGPGLQSNGKRYVFRNMDRCRAFADAVNFAYEHGVRDGMRRACMPVNCNNDRLLLVSGSTPESLMLRRENWWERMRRRWRDRSFGRG